MTEPNHESKCTAGGSLHFNTLLFISIVKDLVTEAGETVPPHTKYCLIDNTKAKENKIILQNMIVTKSNSNFVK